MEWRLSEEKKNQTYLGERMASAAGRGRSGSMPFNQETHVNTHSTQHQPQGRGEKLELKAYLGGVDWKKEEEDGVRLGRRRNAEISCPSFQIPSL